MDKPIAWYDPTNGMVSTDKDSPLFTPLGQVLPLYLPSTWAGLTDEEIEKMRHLIDWTAHWSYGTFAKAIEAKLKEKNTGKKMTTTSKNTLAIILRKHLNKLFATMR